MDQLSHLHERLERLERELVRTRRMARVRTGALALGLGGAVLVAAVPAAAPGDMLSVRRLEVVNPDGRLVLAVGSDERGGRLDVWNRDGQNILRAAANDTGGDLNIWNVAGTAGSSSPEPGVVPGTPGVICAVPLPPSSSPSSSPPP